MREMGGWAKLKNRDYNVRYGKSGVRHMREMGGWAKRKILKNKNKR